MQQHKQHAVIQMEITLKLLQNYHKPYIRETGQHVQYDIEQLKTEPQKFAKWYKQRTNNEENATQKDEQKITNMNTEQKTEQIKKEWEKCSKKYKRDLHNATHHRKRKTYNEENNKINKINISNGAQQKKDRGRNS